MNRLRNKKGFTLVEIVVIIGVMSILALIMVPNLTAYASKADDSKIQANLRSVHNAAETVDKTDLKFGQEGYRERVADFANMPSEEEFDKYHISKSNKGIITVTYNGEGEINHAYNGTGTPAKIIVNAPGDSTLIAGTYSAGYYGLVSSGELISGDELASIVGLTAGQSENSNGGWIKFSIDGKTIYKSQKPFRTYLGWQDLNDKDIVFGNKIIEIGDNKYKVRLIRGFNTPSPKNSTGKVAHRSEWNRLMIPLHKDSSSKNWAQPQNVESNIESWGIGLSDNDLGIAGPLRMSQLVQETLNKNTTIYRGWGSIEWTHQNAVNLKAPNSAWSPVLELVE